MKIITDLKQIPDELLDYSEIQLVRYVNTDKIKAVLEFEVNNDVAKELLKIIDKVNVNLKANSTVYSKDREA